MRKALDLIDFLIGVVIAVVFASALALSMLAVVGRYISARVSLDWISETVIFLCIWAVLLGASRVTRRAAHIRVDSLIEWMPPVPRRFAELFALVLALVLGIFLSWSGWEVVREAMIWDERSISTIRLPMWIYYSALSVSFALQSLFVIERIVDTIAGRENAPTSVL